MTGFKVLLKGIRIDDAALFNSEISHQTPGAEKLGGALDQCHELSLCRAGRDMVLSSRPALEEVTSYHQGSSTG